MLHIDHIALGVQNLYEGSERLRTETGFGDYEGGWFPAHGIANRIMPLGMDEYLEVESVVDAIAGPKTVGGRLFLDQIALGDVFIGWCVRVDTRHELDEIATINNWSISEGGSRVNIDGSKSRSANTTEGWPHGLPMVFYWPDMNEHPARKSVHHDIAPLGVSWLEVGGTAEEMRSWLGEGATNLPLYYNGRPPGVHACGVRTKQSEQVIRRRGMIPINFMYS